MRRLSADFDVVFTSGGVGPTHDDVTVEAVARAFGVEVVLDPTLSELLRGVYGERLTDAHLLMARVPVGAMLCGSPEVQWPTPVMNNVWILPGIPDLFKLKLLTVRAWLRGPTSFVSRALFLRMEEPLLKPLLDAVVAAPPAGGNRLLPQVVRSDVSHADHLRCRDARTPHKPRSTICAHCSRRADVVRAE